jgi:hypothetical protein
MQCDDNTGSSLKICTRQNLDMTNLGQDKTQTHV